MCVESTDMDHIERGYHPEINASKKLDGSELSIESKYLQGLTLPLPTIKGARFVDDKGWEAIMVYKDEGYAKYDVLHNQVNLKR